MKVTGDGAEMVGGAPLSINHMNILGIDPGSSGGLALLSGEPVAEKMPDTERDLYDRVNRWAARADFAYIEQVHAMPGQGVTSMFNFGMNYGGLRMALIAAGIPFETVTPSKWQRALGLPTLAQCGYTASDFKARKTDSADYIKALKKKATAARSKASVKKKNEHKSMAQRLFPGVKVTHALADALLIAEYGRRRGR